MYWERSVFILMYGLSCILLLIIFSCREISFLLAPTERTKVRVSCTKAALELVRLNITEGHLNKAGKTQIIQLKAHFAVSPTWQAVCGLLCGGPSLSGARGTSGSWASSWSLRMSCQILPCTQMYHHWSHRWWGIPLFSYSKCTDRHRSIHIQNKHHLSHIHQPAVCNLEQTSITSKCSSARCGTSRIKCI